MGGDRCSTVAGRQLRSPLSLSPKNRWMMILWLKNLLMKALLVSYTVWSQWGRSKFRKGGVYHIPAEHESWEDIRGNVLNYNEEGGGEHGQRWKKTDRLSGALNNKGTKVINGYNLQKVKKTVRVNAHQLYSTSNVPSASNLCHALGHLHGAGASRGTVYTEWTKAETSIPSFQEHVSQIVKAADNDKKSQPPEILHMYYTEGDGSLAGSLSSLTSSSIDEDLNYDYLCEWGAKFNKLRDLYQELDAEA